MNDNMEENLNTNQPIEKESSLSVKEKFLKKWNSTHETCPICHHITKFNRGITKQNIKKLVWGPPDTNDWLTLVMIIGVIMIAFLYKSETAECKSVVTNLDKICMDYRFSELQIDKMNEKLRMDQNKTKDLIFNLNLSVINQNEE